MGVGWVYGGGVGLWGWGGFMGVGWVYGGGVGLEEIQVFWEKIRFFLKSRVFDEVFVGFL